MKDIIALSDQVRQTAYDIHVYHAHDHLEKVYENALAHRLRKAGLDVKQQHPIKVYDEDGTLIGDYLADLLVEGVLIIELKTAKNLAPEHEAQILGYLKSARLEHGLLINFGAYKFEIRKFAWSENQPQRTQRVLGFSSLRSLRSLRLNNYCRSRRAKTARSGEDRGRTGDREFEDFGNDMKNNQPQRTQRTQRVLGFSSLLPGVWLQPLPRFFAVK